MKHNYSAWRMLEPAPAEIGGGAIITAITEASKKTTEQIEEIKTAQKAALDEAKAQLASAQSEIKTLQESAGAHVKKDQFDKFVAEQEAFRARANSNFGGPQEQKSLAEVITEKIEANKDNFEKFVRKERKSFDFEIERKAVGAVSTANVTGSTNWGAQARAGIITNPTTMRHVRTLLNVMPAGPGTDYYFMRENGEGEGAPAPVAESATKPQFDIDLVESSVKFETIAGWLLISRRALNNIQGITAYLQKKLPEKLLDVEDTQILYGNGTSPNIKGILTAGNFVAGSAAGTTPLPEKILNDLSLLEDTYKRIGTGILMRPADYYTLMKNKASGSGEYDLPDAVTFSNGVFYFLGIPVAKTTALTAGDYAVGDFQNGTDLLIQENMRIEFFEQDSTNVRTNQITVRIEESVALPVYGSNYFVKGSSALA